MKTDLWLLPFTILDRYYDTIFCTLCLGTTLEHPPQNLPVKNTVGAPGFEPGVARSQSGNVSRYTTPRLYF